MPRRGEKIKLKDNEALDVRTGKAVKIENLKNPRVVVTKNGRLRLTGVSPSGSKVSRFLSVKQAEKLRRSK